MTWCCSKEDHFQVPFPLSSFFNFPFPTFLILVGREVSHDSDSDTCPGQSLCFSLSDGEGIVEAPLQGPQPQGRLWAPKAGSTQVSGLPVPPGAPVECGQQGWGQAAHRGGRSEGVKVCWRVSWRTEVARTPWNWWPPTMSQGRCPSSGEGTQLPPLCQRQQVSV